MLTLVGEDTTHKEYSHIASRTTKTVLIAMVLIYLSGSYIFKFFGISPDSLRVFGGIVLLIMGISMVQGREKSVNHSPQENNAAQDKEDITIVPLGIPIIVGPGLATTLLTLSAEKLTWLQISLVLAAIVICAAANYIILKRMPYIKRRLGSTGIKVFSRLMGLVVGSLAAQMIVAGVVALTSIYLNS